MSVQSVLIVAAHPDDEVLGCGATAARHVTEGDTVHVLIMAEGATSRDAGDSDGVEALRASAAAAAKALGTEPPRFAGLPDNRMDGLDMLDIVKSIVNNLFIGEAIEEAKEMVKAGKSIAEPFRRSRIFPPIVVHMIAVGESSGTLEKMLGKVADSYESEVEATVGALTSVLEPLMIVVMGLVIGFIVISILLPIFQMSQIIA